ncbi:MAG: alanyl-tRNA editing protein [Actinobacteria bacterium]|nr:alanyl-tRNA editing protein [Actinomycetota bacterium]
MTEKLYSTDAYAREVAAAVVDVDPDDGRVLLDRTVFYPGGGGQPHDTGALWIGDDRLEVVRVASDGDRVWHWLEGGLPPTGTEVRGEVDWERRYALMRTHTAMHALCGVVWERFQSPVTGGNMEPGEGRLDFEIADWDSDRDRDAIEDELNRQLASARPVEVDFLPREEADRDPSLIRTKVSLLPPDLREVRVIDIVGLDRQADGGTHVQATDEVGRIRIVKVDNKGKGFRRIRIALAEDGD